MAFSFPLSFGKFKDKKSDVKEGARVATPPPLPFYDVERWFPYRGRVASLRRLVFILAIVLLGLLIFFLVVQRALSGAAFYYAVAAPTAEHLRSEPRPMIALEQPNLSREAILSWAVTAATQVMTIGFHNVEAALQDNRRLFTASGWDSFLKALSAADVLERVRNNQLIVTAAPTGAAVIVQQAIIKDRQEWLLQVPMLVTYQTGNRSQTQQSVISLRIVRVPTQEKPDGIGIANFRAQ